VHNTTWTSISTLQVDRASALDSLVEILSDLCEEGWHGCWQSIVELQVAVHSHTGCATIVGEGLAS
jgi:hypothetical protein